jgi:hypothetical protein
LANAVETIKSRDDFVAFASALAQDRQAHLAEWENGDLPNYLEALAAWVEDMDGYFLNRQEPTPEQPSWQLLARILLAAKSYE